MVAHRQASQPRPVKLFTCEQAAALDAEATQRFGLPSLVLMENAARAACEWLAARIREPDESVVFVAGAGNNGGDALAMARHAHVAGLKRLAVIIAPGRANAAASTHAAIAERIGLPLVSWNTDAEGCRALLRSAVWIVDGLLGTGLRGPLREDLLPVIQAVNEAAESARVVSLDVPSGVGDFYRDGFPAVRARTTLCLGFAKRCLYLPSARIMAGTIERLSAGFPPILEQEAQPAAELITPAYGLRLLPEIPPHAYKHKRGSTAVFAGSPGAFGAARLAAEACLRSGAGLVSLFADADSYAFLAAGADAVMVKPWQPGSHQPDPADFDSILCGPGWGRDAGRRAWLERALRQARSGTADADAVHLLRDIVADDSGLRAPGWVLTPHPGEFCALSGFSREEISSDPLPALHALVERLSCCVALKSHVTWIASPGRGCAVFDGMNPRLGTAGSGDVLAGIICGLQASGLDARQAAMAGVALHARAALRAGESNGLFTADDLAKAVSRARMEHGED